MEVRHVHTNVGAHFSNIEVQNYFLKQQGTFWIGSTFYRPQENNMLVMVESMQWGRAQGK